jgi:hypothetical protein
MSKVPQVLKVPLVIRVLKEHKESIQVPKVLRVLQVIQVLKEHKEPT